MADIQIYAEIFGPCVSNLYRAHRAVEQMPAMERKQIMIVDHYDPTADLLVEMLKSEGYTPICCGGDLLSIERIIDARADMLILELGLGNPISMLQLLRELRQHPSTLALPVIVNSTDDQLLANLAEELRRLGCVGVSKPFDIDMLLKLVGTHLALAYGQGHCQPS